jgi:hypothetical protein
LFDKAEVNCTYNNVIPLGLLHGVLMTMTQATDQDIREIKISIDALGKGTEANTKADETCVGFVNMETGLGYNLFSL